MKRKVKVVCIDGVEKTGKNSVATQLWFELVESDNGVVLSRNNEYLDYLHQENRIIRCKTFLSKLYDEVKKGSNLSKFQEEQKVIIKEDGEINRKYGSVYFFILPDLNDWPEHIKKTNEIEYLTKFFTGINQYTIAQGVDIRLIPVNSDERILDIKDKISEILEKEYLFI